LNRVWDLLGAPWIDQNRVQADFDAQGRRDPFGFWCHAWATLLWFLVLPGPMSYVEFGAVPLAAALVLRIPHLWRLRRSLPQPLLILTLLLAGWMALSRAWSLDRTLGFEEVGNLRWVWIMLATWAVIGWRDRLIAALALGFLAANLAQVAHAIGTHAGIAWLTFDRMPDRDSGWWQPVVGGSMLVGALGLHLPAGVMGAGRTRLLGIGGSLITLVGIIATGSRGAWLAAGALILVVVTVAALRVRPHSRVVRPLIVAAAVALVGGAAAWAMLGPSVTRRAQAGWSEITGAIEHQEYETDTGARVLMALWAGRAVAEHPIGGVGAGGYRAWVLQRRAQENLDPLPGSIHNHAHNGLLHLAATTGLVGLALGILVIVSALYGGFKGLGPGGLGSYAAGPAFALIGLLLVSMTDVIQVNSQTGALLGSLCAMCMVKRPSRGPERGRGGGGSAVPAPRAPAPGAPA
jgi:O-antigen ligase